MLTASLETYNTVAKAVGGVALAIFSIRLSLNATLIAQPKSYAEALKDLIAFFIAIFSSPIVFKTVLLTASQVAVALKVPEMRAPDTDLAGQLFDFLKEGSGFATFFVELWPMLITNLAFSAYSLLLGAVISVAPFIFLHQLLSHQSAAITKVFGIFVALASWPILWNAIGLLGFNLWPSFASTTLAGVIFSFLVKILQLVSPLFSSMLITQLSLNGAGRSIGAIRTASRAGVSVLNHDQKIKRATGLGKRK